MPVVYTHFVHIIRPSHPQETCVILLCLRMVKNRRIVLQGRPPPRMTRQNYLKNKNKQLRNVQTSSRNSELVQSQNLKLHGCSSEPSLMKVSTKINSSPLLSPTSICSTTSITTEAATLTESAKSSNSSQNHITAAHQLSVTDQTQPTLLDRLSDHLLPNRMSKTVSTQREPAWTTTRCHGMIRQNQSMARRVYHNRFKKPVLSSRISLGTPNERGRRCSTATGRSRNFHHPNGSTYLAETPSISTMSSPTSTRCHTTQVKSLSSGKTLKYSMDHQPQQKLSRPMETGLLPGITQLKPPSSYSNTGGQNCSAMEGISNAISRHSPFNITTESLTMIGPCASEQLNEETSTCQTSSNSATCKSNGLTMRPIPVSVTQRGHLTKSPKILLERGRKVAAVLPVVDGMTTDVPMQQPPAITYMSAPTAQTQVTSRAIATLQGRSKRLHSSMRWERRPRFVREYVWSPNEKQVMSTALFSETAPPLPQPPKNELSDIQKWNVIRAHSHLFRITTPIRAGRLCDLLSEHPNRPLVESVEEGLKHGFWPWAVTKNSTAPAIVDNAQLQKIKDPAHLQFMNEQRDEEIRLGRFSHAFDILSPGMTTIPLWVVPKPHSDKFRLVVDHSAGDYAPNSFIPPEEASVHLDTLHTLGNALLKSKIVLVTLLLCYSKPMFRKLIVAYQCTLSGNYAKSSPLKGSSTSTTITTSGTEVPADSGLPSSALSYGLLPLSSLSMTCLPTLTTRSRGNLLIVLPFTLLTKSSYQPSKLSYYPYLTMSVFRMKNGNRYSDPLYKSLASRLTLTT